MRFIPTSFLNTGLEPCVVSSCINCTSSSIEFGSVDYDVYLFTSSVQSGGSNVELGELHIESGWTKRAIVIVVGGGGGGSTDGRGGGGGGIIAYDNVQLYPGTGSVQVGQGGNGTALGSPSAFSGDNGSTSIFSTNALNITAGGGEGGTYGGFGGKSGAVFGIQNTASGSAGAGASQSVTGSEGGTGYGFYIGGNNQYFLAGGGGQSSTLTFTGIGYEFGGGAEADARGLGIDGSGGQFYDDAYRFGGGGTGGQYFDAIDNVYRTSAGGSGCVLVAIPKNLCSSSLYLENPSIVDNGLIHSYDVNNIRCMGKELWNTEIKDLKLLSNLNLTSSFVASPSEPDVQYYNYTSSNFVINYDGVDDAINSNNRNFTDTLGFTNRKDFLLGKLNEFDATQDFTIEFIGKIPDTDVNNFNRNLVSLSDSLQSYNFQLIVDGVNPFTSIRNNGVESSAVASNQNMAQHVITYNSSGGQIIYYVNTVPTITFNTIISSSLNEPWIRFGDDTTYTATTARPSEFREMRLYNKILSSQEIQQNYSASLL